MEMPRSIRNMLVATDLDTESVGAVLVGKWLAGKLDAHLHAAHIIQTISASHEQAVPGLADAHVQQAEEELKLFAKAHGLTGNADLHIARGEPEEGVLRLGKQIRNDLLVIGRYGKGGLLRGTMGSVAEHLVRKSPSCVLVVQPEFRGGFKRIAVSTDLEHPSDLALMRTMDLATRFGADEILLLHSFLIPVGYHRLTTFEDARDKIAALEQTRADALIGTCAASYPDAPPVRTVISEGSPTDRIPEFAREHGVDLLLLNTHGRSSIATLLLGRMTERILRESPCSVWAEKSPNLHQGLLEAIGEVLG